MNWGILLTFWEYLLYQVLLVILSEMEREASKDQGKKILGSEEIWLMSSDFELCFHL